MNMKNKIKKEIPTCHFTQMDYDCADDWPNGQIEFWICKHCGHTKEICRTKIEV